MGSNLEKGMEQNEEKIWGFINFFAHPPGVEISRTHDDYGPIQIFDDGDKRYLSFGSHCEQSCVSKSDPNALIYEYTQAMMLALLFQRPQHVTVMGLGGGSLVKFLYHKLIDVHITAVELRPAVVEIAHAFFQLPKDQRIEICQLDAGNYLPQATSASTDIIFCDMFDAFDIDPQQTESWFMQQCHRVLSDEGWLVVNYHQTDTQQLRRISSCFAEVYFCRVSTGNLVMLAGKKDSGLDKLQLKERAAAMTDTLGISLAAYLRRMGR